MRGHHSERALFRISTIVKTPVTLHLCVTDTIAVMLTTWPRTREKKYNLDAVGGHVQNPCVTSFCIINLKNFSDSHLRHLMVYFTHSLQQAWGSPWRSSVNTPHFHCRGMGALTPGCQERGSLHATQCSPKIMIKQAWQSSNSASGKKKRKKI